jgi:hypothetical protein
MTEAEKTPSQQLRAALVAKGYLLQARRYVEGGSETSTRLDYYRKGPRHYLLEIVADRESRAEVACDLWVAVTQSHSVAYAISTLL